LSRGTTGQLRRLRQRCAGQHREREQCEQDLGHGIRHALIVARPLRPPPALNDETRRGICRTNVADESRATGTLAFSKSM